MSNLNISRLDSKIIGELEEPTQELAREAEIGADLPTDLEMVIVRSRDVIGRFYAPNTPGYVLTNSVINRGAIEKVQRLILGKLATDGAKLSMAELCSAAEAMKNLVNCSVGNDLAALKSVEILGFKGKKRNRQANAPQAVITGANPQIVVSANGVAAQTPTP